MRDRLNFLNIRGDAAWCRARAEAPLPASPGTHARVRTHA